MEGAPIKEIGALALKARQAYSRGYHHLYCTVGGRRVVNDNRSQDDSAQFPSDFLNQHYCNVASTFGTRSTEWLRLIDFAK
jgi:hypothetical protein